MEPDVFYQRWATRLDEGLRDQFMMELAALITDEQARERRRLCTDPELYRAACDATAAEIREHMVKSSQPPTGTRKAS